MLRKLLLIVGITTLYLSASGSKVQAYEKLPAKNTTLLSQQDDRSESFSKLLEEGVELQAEDNPDSWRQAIATFESSLEVLQSLEGDNRKTQGLIFHLLGDTARLLDEQQTAIDYYQQALPLRRAAEDSVGEELTLHQLGTVYEYIGDIKVAIDYYQQALAITVESEDDESQASNLNSLGAVYSAIGETDTAIDYYQQVLDLTASAGYSSARAIVLNNIGNLYESLGSGKQALNYYQQAIQNIQNLSDRAYADSEVEATVLNNIGRAYDSLEDREAAFSYLNQALAIYEDAGDRAGMGGVLNNIGALYNSASEQQTALTYYLQALPLLQAVEKRDREANTLNNIGFAYSLRGEQTTAIDYYQQALTIFKEMSDRANEAIVLANIAFLEEEQGQLENSLETISAAIALVEDLRTNISDSDLRASYFTTVQDWYQLKIDLLMQLERAVAAFEVSEAARGRLLIELLNEASVDLRAKVSPELIEQEVALRQSLRTLEDQRLELLYSGQDTTRIAEALEPRSEAIVQRLEQTLASIRRDSPSYAEIVQPSPLSLDRVRQTVLDDETVLLQYAVGEAQSYLWIVSDGEFEVRVLPGKLAIEEVARPFLSAISNSGSTSDVNRAGQAIAAQVLPELPEWTAGKRLLISGDGILSQVPFAALPLPSKTEYTPLLVEHEILIQPSISAVAVLRQQHSTRSERSPSIAILADPVYDASDERVAQQQTKFALSEVVQSNIRDLSRSGIQPLPYTRVEAENIVEIASGYKTTTAYDFEANYEWLTDPAIGDYSILHLATHGLINPINPHLSGLVLSLVDASGQPTDSGFLQLHDIFGLDLSAELVVLSACETGLGPNVDGEGIVGLSRGFMYAGAERVAVSLWNVDDAATASLMSDFYNYMLEEELAPAAALRSAQMKAWQAGQSPYLWAAFTLQGEWQ